ncbi:MAG: class I SAM-dependent methyltransferase [Chloroflexi bacterium]|nr:class I SAM-dependent methyltransferase [Chloroflexota bacterium]
MTHGVLAHTAAADPVESFWDAAYGATVISRAAAEPGAFIDTYLDAVGTVAGLRVLECGQGTGEITVGLARRGAHVTCFDVSAVACEQTRARAAILGLGERVTVLCTSHLQVAREIDAMRFDVVCGRFFLHHIPAVEFVNLARHVLSPVGRCIFWENSARNPLLMFARNYIVGRFGIERHSDAREYPLTDSYLEELRCYFRDVRASVPRDYFLFAGELQPLLMQLDRKAKNAAAKRAIGLVWEATGRVDHRLGRVLPSRLRRYGWWQLVECKALDVEGVSVSTGGMPGWGG